MFLFRCCSKPRKIGSEDSSEATTNNYTLGNTKHGFSFMSRFSGDNREKTDGLESHDCLMPKNASIREMTSLPCERVNGVNPTIAVVGAGTAGIACAVDLIQKGYNVQVLEAKDCLGGRVCTVPFADNVIDLGAQWCHGEEDNVVFEMAKKLNLLESSGDTYNNLQCIRSNGEIVPDTIVEELRKILKSVLTAHRAEMSGYKGSLANFFYERFYAAIDEDSLLNTDRHIIAEFFENFKKIETSDCGPTINEVSTRGFVDYWECEGDYTLNWKTHGFKELLDVLTDAGRVEKKLGVLDGKVLFNTKVEKIYWKSDDAGVRIKCQGLNEILEVDSVVVTVSLGVLKHCGATMFEPALPENKIKAIKAIGFGDVCKIFMEFEEAFWPSDWNGFLALWRDEDLAEALTKDNSWVTEVYGFNRVPYQPRVLLAWIVGDKVKHIENLDKCDVKNELMRLLRRFLPQWEIPDASNISTSNWSSDENFYGAYSFRTLKTETENTGAAVLAQPLVRLSAIQNSDSFALKPVVLFAGEATSLHHFSTVHGALETGRREAKRLIDYYENRN